MRLGLLISNGLILGAIGWMAAFSGAAPKAARIMAHAARPDATRAALQQLEHQAAVTPGADAIVALASAYLDRDQWGLATAVLEKAPPAVRTRPEVAQLYARALFHRGLAREALAVAREASATCADAAGCAPWLIAKTAQQVAFLEQVGAAGIDDPQAAPDATEAAYERSTHEVRIIAMH